MLIIIIFVAMRVSFFSVGFAVLEMTIFIVIVIIMTMMALFMMVIIVFIHICLTEALVAIRLTV